MIDKLSLAKPIALGLLVVAAALLPLGLDAYLMHWVITTLMFIMLALAWDILARTGQVSFGHAAFWGLGAYATVLLVKHLQLPQLAAALVAALCVGLAAAVASVLLLRVRGIYFAILTLACTEVLRVLATMLETVTGGAMGMSVEPLFGGSGRPTYYVLLAAVVVTITAIRLFERSRFNYAFAAIRTSPDVAAAFGVSVRLLKMTAFATSAALTGFVGGIYALHTTYINPESAFDTAVSVSAVIMCIVGGLYTIPGVVIGAVVLTLLQEILRIYFAQGALLIYGAILVAAILFFPNGIVGVMAHVRRTRRSNNPPPKSEAADAPSSKSL